MQYRAAGIAMTLAGCETNRPLPEQLNVVEVEVKRYLGLPNTLASRCPLSEAVDQSQPDAKRLVVVRREYLIECND